MGKTSLATNIAYNIAAAYEGEVQADGSMKAKNGGVVGFYSLEMSSEQLATRIISEQTEVSSSKIRRGDINDADFEKLVACSMMMQKVPLYHRPDRWYLDRPAFGSRPPPEAPARPRLPGGGLYPADDRLGQVGRKPRAGNHPDHHRPEGARQGTERSDHRAVAAVASGGKPRRQAPAALRPS